MGKPRSSWSLKELQDIYKEIEYAVTVPVDIEIRGQQRVLSLDRAEKIPGRAKLIALMECGCRKFRKNCDAPLEFTSALMQMPKNHSRAESTGLGR